MTLDMPIAQQLLTGMADFQSPWSGMDVSAVRKAARSYFKFNIQVASELYWRGKQNTYHLAKDFGALRFPYDNCWMEWRWPSTMIVEGKETPAPQETRLAALTEVGPDIYESKPDEVVGSLTHLLIQTPGHPIICWHVSDFLETDPSGKYLHRKWLYPRDKTPPTDVDMLGQTAGTELNVLYLALNLINCRNVKTGKAGYLSVARSGREKRNREPRLDYHTIMLPGMDHARSSRPSMLGSSDVMPLHRVRGHFKTFTADAPLLGQHVGTYWWGWQVRGSKESGVVVSDYKLGAAS